MKPRKTSGCTGLSARWCPVHGDCLCPEPERALDSEECPLHASWSTHGAAEAFETIWGDFTDLGVVD